MKSHMDPLMSSKASGGMDGAHSWSEWGTKEHPLHGPWELQALRTGGNSGGSWLLKDFIAWKPQVVSSMQIGIYSKLYISPHLV